MPFLKDKIPDVVTICQMEAADLAGYLLQALRHHPEAISSGMWQRRNCIGRIGDEYTTGPGLGADPKVRLAVAEAWQWLTLNGFIVKDHERDNDWYIATRRTLALGPDADLRIIVAASELPAHFLDPEIARLSRSLFLQGRLDTAVFEAFKALEVEIRNAGELGDELVGTKLVGRAFQSEDGPLTDKSAESGERVALMNLMSGAIGSYKNPHSHRRVALEPPEAREMIIIASHLLKIVRSRGRVSHN